MIDIIDLRKSFDGQEVLKGINLTIAEKELIIIMGKSGGGKSVIIKHIMGLLKADGGNIFIDKTDITKLDVKGLDRIRDKLGVLFQGGALFDSLTVFGNIAFPLKEKTKAEQTGDKGKSESGVRRRRSQRRRIKIPR